MIKAFDYLQDYHANESEFLEAIRRVLTSGQLILGPEVSSFETEFAQHVGAKHAIGVNSATDALILALRALNIGSGDEVITVANTAVPTISAIRAVGAIPKFVDVKPETLTIDVSKIEAAIGPQTRALVPVHLYGNPVGLNDLLKIAQTRNLRVIEDCAQAQGAMHHGRQVGTFGDIGCFSFYPTKNLGAFGDGGMCVTQDSAIAEKLRMLRMYGFRGDQHAHIEGFNSRLDELQAAILRVKLRRLNKSIQLRRKIASKYREGLKRFSSLLLIEEPQSEHAYHLFVVRLPNREKVISQFKKRGIGFGIHYPLPIHLMEAYQFLEYRIGALPETEKAATQILSLPLYPELKDEEVGAVIDVLLEALN